MDGGLNSVKSRDSFTKLTREGVSADLGRSFENGCTGLDPCHYTPACEFNRRMPDQRIGLKMTETHKHPIDPHPMALISFAKGYAYNLIAAVGLAIDGNRSFSYPQPTNRPNRAPAAARNAGDPRSPSSR
jgi:hypothetical protein